MSKNPERLGSVIARVMCRNCALFGREARATHGHTCVDVDPCPKCGGPRMLRVIAIAAEGGVTRERWCKACSRERRERKAEP